MERSTTRTIEYDFLAAVGLLVADQLSKDLVAAHPAGINVFGVSISEVVNPVGVLGFDISNTWLIPINILICLFLLGLLIYTAKRPPTRLGLWLLLAGALSNLIDRIQHGGAVDIISIQGGARFNLADVAIILGALSLVRSLWWRPREN